MGTAVQGGEAVGMAMLKQYQEPPWATCVRPTQTQRSSDVKTDRLPPTPGLSTLTQLPRTPTPTRDCSLLLTGSMSLTAFLPLHKIYPPGHYFPSPLHHAGPSPLSLTWASTGAAFRGCLLTYRLHRVIRSPRTGVVSCHVSAGN